MIKCVCIYILFNAVIQLQTASQEKSARYMLFYILIRTYEVHVTLSWARLGLILVLSHAPLKMG